MNHIFKDRTTSNISYKLFSALAVFTAMTFMGSGAHAMDDSKKKDSNKMKTEDCRSLGAKGHDNWIQGKLEATYLLNRHLNPMEIDTEVKNSIVFLSGNVDTDIDKDLAGEIAKSIEGVKDVNNKLTVRPDDFKKGERKSAKDRTNKNGERGFVQKVEDASTTATVKVKLFANSNTDGSDINVDTMNNIVTLKGHVQSSEEKELAEKIAMNTEDVLKVNNQLKVDTSKE